MLKHQSPLTGAKRLRGKPGRKPLQPKNSDSQVNPTTDAPLSKPKQGWTEKPVAAGDSNKENHPTCGTPPPTKLIEPLDASLAEELSSVKKKLERLRLDRERTEKMLKERDLVLDLRMEEILQRGEAQKRLEIEVDRLYRLKQLQVYAIRISPIRSLREKEHERELCGDHLQETGDEDLEGSLVGSAFPSPSWASSSVSPKLVAVT